MKLPKSTVALVEEVRGENTPSLEDLSRYYYAAERMTVERLRKCKDQDGGPSSLVHRIAMEVPSAVFPDQRMLIAYISPQKWQPSLLGPEYRGGTVRGLATSVPIPCLYLPEGEQSVGVRTHEGVHVNQAIMGRHLYWKETHSAVWLWAMAEAEAEAHLLQFVADPALAAGLLRLVEDSGSIEAGVIRFVSQAVLSRVMGSDWSDPERQIPGWWAVLLHWTEVKTEAWAGGEEGLRLRKWMSKYGPDTLRLAGETQGLVGFSYERIHHAAMDILKDVQARAKVANAPQATPNHQQ